MKKLVVLCFSLMFLFVGPLFAEWNTGNIVDDFGDPTGKKFVYTTVDGTFSNSATTSSPCSVRIIAKYEVNPFASENWAFEIHNYGFDNPVNTFSSDSEGTIKIKDELKEISTFKTSNNKYENCWNKLNGNYSSKFTKLVKNNNNLKVAVSCESTRYNFSIPTIGAKEILNSVEKSITPKIEEWIKIDAESYLLEFYEIYTIKYREMNIKKTFPLYTWNYYEIITLDGSKYLVHLTIDDEDLSKDGYAKLHTSVNSLSESNIKEKAYGEITKATFTIDSKEYTLINKEPDSYSSFKNMSEMKQITKALESSNSTNITISYTENKVPIELTLNGKEMAKIINSL